MGLFSKTLTGKIHYRKGAFGKIILRIQYKTPDTLPGSWTYKWTDANENDIAQLMTLYGPMTFKGKE